MEAINNAEKIINKIKPEDNYNSLYLFTNENLKEILQRININNKKILTVCASSDQYFNFLLHNPQNIELFDINKLTEYLFYLKKSALINLDYELFTEFLIPKKIMNKKIFSKDIYNLIRNDLPDKYLLFWDRLFNNYKNTELFKSDLFKNNKKYTKEILNNNEYLSSEKTYNQLKETIKNIEKVNFYNIDIFKEFINNNKKYDFIYLSNIIDYLPIKNKCEYFKKIKELIKEISNNLNENGIIGLNYLFYYLDEYWEKTNNYIKPLARRNVIYGNRKNNDYEIIDFKSGQNYKSRKIEDKDALILYKKKNY